MNMQIGCPPFDAAEQHRWALDVHKNSMSIAINDDGRDGEVRYYGKIDNNISQLDKVIRKLISKGATL